MKVAITGGTGFVGKHLTDYFINKNVPVLIISRNKQKFEHPLVQTATWTEMERNMRLLEDVTAIVNLAGETINQRWSEAAKKRILDSRLEAVKRVEEIIGRMEEKPVLVNASAIGIYAASDTATYTEDSELTIDNFLGQVVDQWEAAAEHIEAARVVLLRFGVVLGTDGGALPKMITPFKLGLGGRIGSGKQPFSWVHIKDLCRLIDFCIAHEDIEGPINATAPHPLTNDEFGRALAQAMNRPYLLPVPAFVLKLAFGEMSTLLLEGQRVYPVYALNHDFQFHYPLIDLALNDLLGQGTKAVAAP